MEFGICKSFEYAKQIRDAGFDYIEINLTKMSALTDDELIQLKKQLDELGLKSKISNCFFPADIALVGENVDYDKIKQYTELALSRANAFGVEVAVLGSGKSRTVPDGFSREEATAQFKKIIGICSEVAKKYGIKIAIEPLSLRDTNFLNTVGETAELCDKLGLDNIGIAVDLFHMFMMNESLVNLENAKRHIFHLHIAKPDSSRFSPSPEDADILGLWAQSIKSIGYSGRMSLESTSKEDFEVSLQNMNAVKYIFE